MAVVLGTKPLSETDTYADYAIGLALPLQIGNSAFRQTFTMMDQVGVNIQNLLLTTRGERIMQPEFGSYLGEILFEQETDNIAASIENAITSALAIWLPYVSIHEINIDTSNQTKDKNTAGVALTFTVDGYPTLGTVTFTVQG